MNNREILKYSHEQWLKGKEIMEIWLETINSGKPIIPIDEELCIELKKAHNITLELYEKIKDNTTDISEFEKVAKYIKLKVTVSEFNLAIERMINTMQKEETDENN